MMNLIKDILSKLFLGWSPSFGMRVYIVMSVLLVYVGCIVMCSFDTLVVERDHYEARISNLKKEGVEIPQMRGVIYSESGDMIAASLPQFDIYFDFRSAKDPVIKTVTDTVNGVAKTRRIKVPMLPLDTINYYFGTNGPAAQYMSRLTGKTAAYHGQGVRNAFAHPEKRYLALRAVPYLEYQELWNNAPFFRKDKNRICCYSEERPHRYRPFGEYRMAAATIGGVLAADTFRIVDDVKVNWKGHGRNGLEQTFDSLLAGRPGTGYIEKIQGRRTRVVTEEPVDGADVYTTLDMEMQMVLDYELNKRILELQAAGGWAAVMEVKTGKIKAISNLKRQGNQCTEDYNHFVQDLYDPGSTFKTVSYMVLLDDGKVTPDTWVDTGNYPGRPGTWNYHGKEIRDDHPVGSVTADEAMVQSSNISLAKLTVGAYENDKQRYLDLIDKTGIFADMHLNREFQGAQRPRNRKVNDANWSKVSLGQISYGYETRIPGMYMLNFYNAIANDGKLMRPYIVDRVVKDGKVIVHYKPEVMNKSICKTTTLSALRHALEGVVERGTAATQWYADGRILREGAKSRKLKIAGKTGTAQRYANGSYSGNGHYVSFAGYFPADKPQYSMIVVIDARPGGNFGRPGGGYMAGPVFRNFAEKIYSRSCLRTVDDIQPDSASLARSGLYPRAKRGPEGVTAEVIGDLGLSKHINSMDVVNVETASVTRGRVPNVSGMGLIDAMYMLESAGLKVNVSGRGRVVNQSIPAGNTCQKGQTISIVLN